MYKIKKFGGMDKPNIYDSISALYIAGNGLTLKDKYYKLTFILNGLSSCLGHSPYISNNNKKLSNFMNNLDGITILYPILGKAIFYKKEKEIYLFIAILINLITKNKLVFLLNKVMIFIIILLIYRTYKNFDLKLIILLLFTSLSKIYENKTIIKVSDRNKIKLHSLWHILGTHFFKKFTKL